MTRIGVIARADRGGLAQMTSALVQHVRPDAVLLVDLGLQSRGGPCDPDRVVPYAGQTWIATHHPGQAKYGWPTDADMFFASIDVCYTAETYYDARTVPLCRQYGVPLVLHAMPELLADREVAHADRLWLPTPWLADDVARRRAAAGKPPPELVPVPIVEPAVAPRVRDAADVFYCDGGEAFHDRNGVASVLQAAGRVDRPCLLYVRGGEHDGRDRWQAGRVTIERLAPVESYVDAIPDDVDVALMPRRYGGLTLGVQEAAARGIPTIMSALPPQDGWYGAGLISTDPTMTYTVPMKGGTLPVHGCDPATIAQVWSGLTGDTVERLSCAALEWADRLAWSAWTDRYRTLLGA